MKPSDPIASRLAAVAKESGDLKGEARLYETILPLLRDAPLYACQVSLTPDQARAKMEKGLPLLHGLDLELDGQSACELMSQLAHAVENTSKKKQADPARHIRQAVKEERLDVSELLAHVAAGEDGIVEASANSMQLSPALLLTLARYALKPAMHEWRRQLESLAGISDWDSGYCFVCGAYAALGELQGNDQAKHLRCGRCGADWLFIRLRCIYCGNEDHSTLGYLSIEGQHEKMRVEVCDKCKGYLKVIAAFTPTAPDMLPVEDLATLYMDFIAQERGYARR